MNKLLEHILHAIKEWISPDMSAKAMRIKYQQTLDKKFKKQVTEVEKLIRAAVRDGIDTVYLDDPAYINNFKLHDYFRSIYYYVEVEQFNNRHVRISFNKNDK
jgi:hypothetical protein